ncbi:hypothetical protein KC19_VG279400 [Ceratodon purpureus]|uniref:Uncharacterized protein n=1 Tax=Ceratodon purpureus TaxID=3225 RepID=A0A8T0HUJ0_CERPU|nr:hypothetical protein KC19_VG279400 [Ceratodon purpureus]
MERVFDPTTAITFSVWLLLLLFNNKDAAALPELIASDTVEEDPFVAIVENLDDHFNDAHNQMRATLHHFRLCLSYNFLDEDVGY